MGEGENIKTVVEFSRNVGSVRARNAINLEFKVIHRDAYHSLYLHIPTYTYVRTRIRVANERRSQSFARHNAIIIIMPDRYAIFVASHGVCHYKDGGTKAHGMPRSRVTMSR